MMATLMSWFGGGVAANKSQQSKEAILKLRQQLDMLRKREEYTEKQMFEQDAIARKNVTTNKTVARAALKRKKQLETNLTVTKQHINTLEEQMNAVETANLNMETVKVMKAASDAMAGMHKGVGMDKVDNTIDEIRENMQLNKEITDAISSVQLVDPEAEEDLDAMLEDMEQEALDEQMISAPSAPVSVQGRTVQPVAATQVAEDDEEAELRKLQAEMAM